MMAPSNGRVTTIDAYIDACPPAVRPVLQMLRQTITEAVPDAVECIRYNMPAFQLHGTTLMYFAAWKKHISLYPFTEAMATMLTDAAGYKTSGKGTIQFPLDQPLPFPLIRDIVAVRVHELRAHAALPT